MDLIAILFLLWMGKKLVGNSLPRQSVEKQRQGVSNLDARQAKPAIDPRLVAATQQLMSHFRQLPENEQRALLSRLNERQTRQFNHLCNQVANLSEQQQMDLIQQQERHGLYTELSQWAMTDGARMMNQSNRWWQFTRK